MVKCIADIHYKRGMSLQCCETCGKLNPKGNCHRFLKILNTFVVPNYCCRQLDTATYRAGMISCSIKLSTREPLYHFMSAGATEKPRSL